MPGPAPGHQGWSCCRRPRRLPELERGKVDFSPALLLRSDPHPAGGRRPAGRRWGSDTRSIPGRAAELRTPRPRTSHAPPGGGPSAGIKLGSPIASGALFCRPTAAAAAAAPPSRRPALPIGGRRAGAARRHGGGRCRGPAARCCCCARDRDAARCRRRPSAPAAGAARGQALHLVSPQARHPRPPRGAGHRRPPRPPTGGGGGKGEITRLCSARWPVTPGEAARPPGRGGGTPGCGPGVTAGSGAGQSSPPPSRPIGLWRAEGRPAGFGFC